MTYSMSEGSKDNRGKYNGIGVGKVLVNSEQEEGFKLLNRLAGLGLGKR